MFDTTDEKARLKRQMTKEAIDLAMQGQWREAISVNKAIIENVPVDVEAYNRLGKAYMELGEYDQAKEAYNNALELDPDNTISKKNLSRLSQLEGGPVKTKEERPKAAPHIFIGDVGKAAKAAPHIFIGDLGKAGVFNLHDVASGPVLAKMSAGDQVFLKVVGQQLNVENEDGEYLGKLEPQYGYRLARLIEGGNEYTSAIVSVDDSMARVIIREVFQHPSQTQRLSFPARAAEGFRPHVKDTLLRQGGADEEYFEEAEEIDYGDLDDGELLPDGFSILEERVSVDELADDDLIEEE
ncbi:MAG: tetratricopeptide repeat protein [Dehalococcoidia bacterium]